MSLPEQRFAPDISVVIPTYQRADLVCRAVESCLAQPCTVEVIVVDDGSSDGTGDRLKRAYPQILQGVDGDRKPWRDGVVDKSVVYIDQPNMGVCAARNRGLGEASGRYVKFLDSDDELIPGALGEELRIAEESGAEAVVSSWEERWWCDGREQEGRRCRKPAPLLEHPVDDMLRGEAPWTAAALYRREFVADLRWNADFGKADDWGWAWTVCLAGARYARMQGASCIYWHHEGARITSVSSAFTDSTVVRQRILGMVESALDSAGALTDARRKALVQYYYKDRLVVCDGSVDGWRRLWAHCQTLAPGFRPVEWHPVVNPFVRVFGVLWGVRLYVTTRTAMRWLAAHVPLCGRCHSGACSPKQAEWRRTTAW